MSFGKLAASAFSGTVENTLTLANLNFDFSLIKIEAPKEYKEFGMRLSGKRSKEAESGLTHVTARKLGALFAGIVPACPRLIAAYGLRGTTLDGIFSDQIGADGTSIWAAATSGNSAIAVHLLACMLARIWPATTAVSIWVQLIQERKKALLDANGGEFANLSSLSAAQVTISREQVAKWDGSARAWLQTPDAAKQFPQKQLMVIVNSINTPVNEKPTVYESVIQAWLIALTTIERLLSGASQSIDTGAPLLGLSSWHLYPDMLVLGSQTKEIQQHDELIPASTLVTVGLRDNFIRDRGVFWSLPLAYLRFYGDPVVVRSSTMRQSGLSIDELLQVALGSFLGQCVPSIAEFEEAAQLLMLISSKLRETTGSAPTWLRCLAETAENYLNSSGLDRTEYTRLVKSGRRRYPYFLAEQSSWLNPFFGLTVPKTLLDLAYGPEERIRILRSVASKYGKSARYMIIQYTTGEALNSSAFECASAVPIGAIHRDHKGSEAYFESEIFSYIRWLDENQVRSGRQRYILEKGDVPVVFTRGMRMARFFTKKGSRWNNAPLSLLGDIEVQRARDDSSVMLDSRSHSCSTVPLELELVAGDPDVAALYAVQSEGIDAMNNFTIQEMKDQFTHKCISPIKLKNHLLRLGQQGRRSFETIKSLRALCTVSKVYKSLLGARIAIKVAEKPLYRHKWLPRDRRGLTQTSLRPFSLHREEIFSCIARFESGSFDIDPCSVDSVMALSSGNSIFIASHLLVDPADRINPCQVKRIVGNVSRPGMAMMITPSKPKMSRLGDDTWNQINHNQFNGQPGNFFQNTTLHLSYTDWELPIDTGDHGKRDRELFFLETPVSLHHRGLWVADIDILKMFKDNKFRLLRQPACPGHRGATSSELSKEIIAEELVSIDSWDELIEPPLERAIVRAHGNWQARLAAAALSVQRGHVAMVVPAPFCWNCYCEKRRLQRRPSVSESNNKDMNNSEEYQSYEQDSSLSSGDEDTTYALDDIEMRLSRNMAALNEYSPKLRPDPSSGTDSEDLDAELSYENAEAEQDDTKSVISSTSIQDPKPFRNIIYIM